MNFSHQASAVVAENPAHHPEHDSLHPPRSRRRRIFSGVIGLIVLGLLGLGGWIMRDQLRTVWVKIQTQLAHSGHGEPGPSPTANRDQSVVRLVDGIIILPTQARRMMGLATTPVLAQTEPIRLELLGTTDYITDTVTDIRPMFKGRVDRVHVTVNQAVKRGDALVDLYSKELAEAKSAYEIEHIQWIHDHKLLEAREKLVKSNAISQIIFEETRNSEMKSHKEYEVARDKLLVYGLTEAEVERVEDETGSEKARITLRSSTDGFVIARNVVPGNLYDENDTLLKVAPLDRLWVWGNVFESDLDLVQLGQLWEIGFPFLQDKVLGRVEYVSNRVDPNTHAIRVRTSIPNLHGRLKSDMLVRGTLAIEAVLGQTVIPRTALIVDGGQAYVFIQKPAQPNEFERRLIDVAQEKDDHVVVARGLKPGELVVNVGGLLLAQTHDDLTLVASGAPVNPAGEQVD